MARPAIATTSMALGHEPEHLAALSTADLEKMQEYQKIVYFRDAVISGKHPRIKVPSSAAKPATPSQAPPPAAVKPSSSAPRIVERVAPAPAQSLRNGTSFTGYQVDNMQSFNANSQQPAVSVAATDSAPPIPGVPNIFASSKVEINPILLEKSEDLVKAEMKLQRQRLEKAIKDQVELKRSTAKTVLQPSEQIADFDLSDILAKALTLVQATAAPDVTTNNTPKATNASEASDSFDENTFYSSQHDTPWSQSSPRAEEAPQDVRMQDATPSTSKQALGSLQQAAAQPVQPVSASTTLPRQTLPGPSAFPAQSASIPIQYAPNSSSLAPSLMDNRTSHLSGAGRRLPSQASQWRQREDAEAQVISSDSGAASRSDNSGITDADQLADLRQTQNFYRPLPKTNTAHHDSPLIRAHDLSPVAPQPAHVSPLATARQPLIPQPEVEMLQGTPAQVTALRQGRGALTSPESSPQGEKGSKKRNKKKNKRRGEGRMVDVPGSPDIKPEPRSPSPVSAPRFTRPNKRQRAATRQEPEIIYDEPIIERPSSRVHRDYVTTAPMQMERVPSRYERVDDQYARQVRQSVAPAGHRLEPTIYEERRPDGTIVQYIRRVQSPPTYAAHYSTGEPRSIRSASYAVANPTYRDIPTYQRDGRSSVRPYADRARSRSPLMAETRSPLMAPPAPPRIIVDEFGREYVEPSRNGSLSRRLAMPNARLVGHEGVFEAAPVRAASHIPTPSNFGDDRVTYRRASPEFVAPRRVITQPEYGADYRSYRKRDYSLQPAGLPDNVPVMIRGTAERRVHEEIREYLPRATSVRPTETLPYYERVQSTRPEVTPRPYTSSVHPEIRREAVPQVIRDFNVRPVDAELPRRQYSVHPSERYYDRPSLGGEEMTYVDRPRAIQQEVVYADEGRRPVYR